MLKTEFVSALASRYNININEAQKWLVAVLDTVEDALARDGKVNLRGLGSFFVVEKKARQVVHPRTGEAIEIPASRAVRFSPAEALKSLANDPLYEKILKK
ncbi:MAG: HU family DNA-binding protein [Desulfovibrio sp.]|nr:HU family DNA-binding protein [Desulfovibrio sp.]